MVAGSVAVDLSCDYAGMNGSNDPSPQLHTSNLAHIRQSIGGVGRNVALAAHRVSGDMTVRLCNLEDSSTHHTQRRLDGTSLSKSVWDGYTGYTEIERSV
jgi:sugar/nucleoside kinase (ribokinase family)